MQTPSEIVDALVEPIFKAPKTGIRKVVALAGPPASGKSTIAEALAERLSQAGCKSAVVPMDGFHLDNQILIEKGLLERKGAPETFDAEGFLRLIQSLTTTETAYYPVFDRTRDIAIAGAGQVGPDCECVVVEGNYLLFDAPIWRGLNALWDFSVRLDVPSAVLRQRLIDRWLAHGMSKDQATARAEGNDLSNAKLVETLSLPADFTVPAS